jgi:pyridoxamine 5'-phosphate oxidase-like protein
MIQIVNKAKEEINKRLYLTLATVDNNSAPWNAPVYSAFDLNYNFYWMSSLVSQHSTNIRSNSKTFAVLYDSTVLEGTGFGVYLSGNSYELDSIDINEINHGITVMGERIHRSDLPPASNYLSPFPRRVYKFIPLQAWVNTIVDIQGKKVDQRLEITNCLLKEKRNLIKSHQIPRLKN